MSDTLFFLLKLLAAIGCGLVAGVFLAFSSFVMSALARLPSDKGIAAMQSINVTVINVAFMTLLFGTAVLCTSAAAFSVIARHRPGSAMTLTGAVLYLVGTIGTTIVFNVPRNDVLARVDPERAASAHVWAAYLREWTLANHCRTAAAVGAAMLLTLAMTCGQQ